MLIQQRPQGVHICGALMKQSLLAAKHGRAGLLLNRLGLHEAHLGLAGRDNDRLGICGTGRNTFDKADGSGKVIFPAPEPGTSLSYSGE